MKRIIKTIHAFAVLPLTIVALSLLMAVCMPGSAQAQQSGETAADLLRDQQDEYAWFFWMGFIQAMHLDLNLEGSVCTPERVTQGQVLNVVIDFIEDHPEHQHELAYGHIGLALMEAFPCDPRGQQ